MQTWCIYIDESGSAEANERYPPIIELSEHRVVEGNPRRTRALQLVSEYNIPPETAYQIVDENIKLAEVLRRKRDQPSTARRRRRDD